MKKNGLDKKGRIGLRIVRDVLAIQKMMNVSDKDLFEMSEGEIGRSTLRYWRFRVKEGGSYHVRYGTIAVALDAMDHKLAVVKKRHGRNQ